MRRTKEQAEQTRCAILAAAETLFLQQGVAHTSLEQIARQAGVTRGAVYWHFANKADLFNALLNQVRLPPEQLAERLADCDGGDALLSLRHLIIEAIENLARDAQKRRIFTILLHRCEFTDELRDAELQHHRFIDAFIGLLEALFARPACRARLQAGFPTPGRPRPARPDRRPVHRLDPRPAAVRPAAGQRRADRCGAARPAARLAGLSPLAAPPLRPG
ncbi:TetR family transcriptional regulator [Pseudomonas lalucatii]|nr:TetR family transcriptional regulator [Pseudomonas lalucatii]